MRAIFISYRREDTEGYAGRLYQDLCERFGKDSVFMDVAGIEPGRDFRRVIERQVASCGVLLALIGKSWVSVTDAKGTRRVDDPNDFVRLEVASALKRDIPVIPVLVQQADMPRAEQLPEDLQDLAYRNNVELTHARWASDVQVLITALAAYVVASEPPAGAGVDEPSTRARSLGPRASVIAPLAIVAIGGVAYVAWDRLVPDAKPPVPTSAPASRTAAASQAQTPTSAPAPRVAEASTASSAVAEAANVPKRSVDKPVAARVPAPRQVDKPVVARPPERDSALAAAAPGPAPAASTSGRAPAPTPSALAAAPDAPPVLLPQTTSPEVSSARRDPSLDLYGSPGAASMVTRTITIKPETSYVNVTGGEVVRFQVGDKSFVWNFNGERSSFDLARVAPPSTLDRKVTAYVAPNPMYPRRH